MVAEREILDNHECQEEASSENVKQVDVSEVSEDSAVDTQDKLISFDDPVNKLDHMTLDDLNDDDFDPRAEEQNSDSSECDDFNPKVKLEIKQETEFEACQVNTVDAYSY